VSKVRPAEKQKQISPAGPIRKTAYETYPVPPKTEIENAKKRHLLCAQFCYCRAANSLTAPSAKATKGPRKTDIGSDKPDYRVQGSTSVELIDCQATQGLEQRICPHWMRAPWATSFYSRYSAAITEK
jgi:hypothetical protein